MKHAGTKILTLLCLALLFTLVLGAGAYADDPSHSHDDITFTAWESTSSLPNEAGSYYLTGDVTLGDTWTVPSGTTNLCLNGKEVSVRTAPGGAVIANYSIVNVPNGAILNLYDEAGNLGKLANAAIRRESKDKIGGGVYIDGTLNMYGGKICDNDMIFRNFGAGVYVSGTGTFNMHGGEISNNIAGYGADGDCYGGGVYVAANGTFTMSGGLICNNSTGNAGGGVYVATNGTFTMSGGTIRDNTAIGDGGGVDNYAGHFAMSGGTITGNTVTSGNGGGIIVEGDGVTCSLSGSADISGNHKGSDDNNIYLQSGRYIKVDGQLTNTNRIGVTMETAGVFTTGSTDALKASDYLDKFVSDSSAYFVQTTGNELTLKMDGSRIEVSYLYYEDDAAAIAQKPTTGTQACMKVESSDSEVVWSDDWYVVSEDTVIDVANTRIRVNGVVNLILMDGKTLTANQGIHVGPNATLNIYAQSTGAGAGTLIANGYSAGAGIGGAVREAGGTITIHGGTVTATGGEDGGGAGIGGGGNGGAGGTITIHGGTVTGTGKRDGAGIGGGPSGEGGTITINGGTVTATSIEARYPSSGAGIGSGYRGAGGTITINGGTVNATGGQYGGAGIGSGKQGANVTVIINDGEVTATGGQRGGAGIGGGDGGAGGTITINGGTVNATGGQRGGAGIGGGGNRGAGGNVTITGGTVNATGGDKGAGIGGGGLLSAGGTITINGGTVTATGGTSSSSGIGGGTGGQPGTVNLGNGMLVWAGAGENPQNDNKNIALSFETTHSQQYVYAKISPPIITGADLVLNGTLDFRFYVALPAGFNDSSAYMTFTIPGRNPETGTTGRSVKVNFADADNAADGQKIFPCPVYSIEMAKPITAAFHYGDNQTVEKTYSIKDYLTALDGMTGKSSELEDLIVATRDYGHYMQLYLSELHGFNLVSDYPAMPAGSDITPLSNLDDKYKRQLISCDNTLVQSLGFYDTFNASTILTIMVKLKEPATVTATVDGVAREVTERGGNIYQVQIPDIAANNLGTDYHVVFSVGDSVICDLNASALSYAWSMLNSGGSRPNEANALTAFYNYYVAASAYNG